MSILNSAALWLRAFFGRTSVESEMEKEMRLHLEMEIEQNVRRGMSPSEARRVGMIAFGGMERAKEEVRDERGTRWLEETISDVRYVLRGFRKRPLFAAGVIGVIALGIGPNIAIFGVIHDVLLAPLPYPDGDRMAYLEVTSNQGTILTGSTSDQIATWRARTRTIESFAMYDRRTFQVGDPSLGEPTPIRGTRLAPGVIAFAGARTTIGRDITASDTLRDASPVLLIGDSLWRHAYQARGDVLGKTITLDSTRYTIVGVVPAGFSVPFENPQQLYPALRTSARPYSLSAVAKVKRGVSVEEASRELARILPVLDTASRQDVPRLVTPADEVSQRTRSLLYVLFGAVVVVLLIACANVANLMLVRAWDRQREFAVRAALGAGRFRLMRQVLTESLVLAMTGGVVSIGVARVTFALLRLAEPPNRDMFASPKLSLPLLLWGVGLTIGVALAFGIAPALFAARTQTSERLKAGARSASTGRTARRLRSTLVIVEVALSTILLASCGLLLRTIIAAQRAEIGLDTRGLYGMTVRFDRGAQVDSVHRAAIFDDMVQRVRAIPGIADATIALSLPPDFAFGVSALVIEGRDGSPNDSLGLFSANVVRPEYFNVTGTKVIRGRPLGAETSIGTRAQNLEIVINESFARKLWSRPENAIGARLRMAGAAAWSTVVGVATDVRVPMERRPGGEIQLYQALPRAPLKTTLLVRSSLPTVALHTVLDSAIRASSPHVRTLALIPAADGVTGARAMQRYLLNLLGGFAFLALLLTAVGVHAVLAYSVEQRAREIGIRVALGAERSAIVHLILRQAFAVVAVGATIGGIGGVLSGRAMRALLYQVSESDPMTLAGVAVTLSVVALLACYHPTRRAVVIDPMEALRAD